MRFVAPQARYFFLHGQEKVPKKKAARFLARQTTPGTLCSSSIAAHFQTRYAQTRKRFFRAGLRCSAASYGVKIKTGGFIVNRVGCFDLCSLESLPHEVLWV